MNIDARNSAQTASRRFPVARGTMAVRVRQLCLCLLGALPAASSLAAQSLTPGAKQSSTQLAAAERPNASATVWDVTSCTDGDTGSLRDIIESPGKAQSGDSINLSGIPAVCGMASVITLLNGEIHIAQDDLELHGPAPVWGMGTVAISGGGTSGVFRHTGTGTLSIHTLTLQDGYVHDPAIPAGGCILSQGNIELDQSRVIGCTARSDMGYAHGGGIFAQGNVKLVDSTISGNKVIAPSAYGVGGGVCAHDLLVKYSSIDHNTVYDSMSGDGLGGGAAAYGTVGFYHSTIDHNTSHTGSAFASYATTRVSNSTISSNSGGTSAIRALAIANNSASMEFANSTIAFNQLSNGYEAGAVSFHGLPGDTLSLYSSIIAKNTIGNTPADVYIAPGHGSLAGADNLVIATNVVPAAGVVTVMANPQLGPLQLNGGRLPTHALLPGSPAIGHGNHDITFPPNEPNQYDGRGPGYPRTTTNDGNITTDIGAFQFDSIFFNGFD